MQKPRIGIASVLAFTLFCLLLPTPAYAHDAGTYTILLRQDGPSPSNPELMINDSALWYNVDDTENLTHRIVYDGNGDGLFNGSMDWDSGELSRTCEIDDEGNQTDPNCSISFTVSFDEIWGPGTYYYQDMLSNGTILNATLVVIDDSHVEDSSQPPSGYSFGGDGGEGGGEDDLDATSEADKNIVSLLIANKLPFIAVVSSLLVFLVLILKTIIIMAKKSAPSASALIESNSDE